MDDFIFEQRPNKTEILDTKYFTVHGQEEFLDEEGNPRISQNSNIDKVFAKQIIRQGGQPRYSIRIDINNKFVNPMSIYDDKNNKSTFLDSVCRANNKFVDVNLKVFNMYLKFLRTKNLSWFYNAEREMI